MELRRPTYKGATTEAENEMLHEAALRVQGRQEDSERRRARAEAARRFSVCIWCLFALGVVLLAQWVWRSGVLNSVLTGKDVERSVGDLFEPASGAPAAPAASAAADGTVKQPAENVADAKAPAVSNEADARKPASPLAEFAGASFDYWKNAVAEDRPGKKQRRGFTCLVPDDGGGFTLLKLEMGGGQPFSARIFGPDGGVTAIDKPTFDHLTARTPYLVARQGRAYFCSPGQEKLPDSFPVPPKGGVFAPARAAFGALADCLPKAKVRLSEAKFHVALHLETLRKEVPVAVVGPGATVSHEAFAGAVRALVADADAVQSLLKSAKVRVTLAK